MGVGESLFSKLYWRIKQDVALDIDSVRIIHAKYLSVYRKERERIFTFMRVSIPQEENERRIDYSESIRITVQQQRMKGLFDALHKSKMPFIYLSLALPSRFDEADELFEFDLIVGTWVDCKVKEVEKALNTLEQRASVLSAALSVALPESTVRMLSKGELREFVNGFFLPKEPRLQQRASSDIMSSLESFEERSPTIDANSTAPDFYVPNSIESGPTGILVGKVMSKGGEAHNFNLQLADIKRHVIILGMTGSGKSTTAGVIAKQLAGMGLPVIILDWHNEHGRLISSIGGKVLAAGRENFTINPLEFTSNMDLIEHVAMVSDIFSDIYHFTHPQAYMFRNALQKCLYEAQESSPSISSLVRLIESYPLRSAYDNETKVALLRRLVPLTQGQAGKALDGPSNCTIEELLDKVLCVELGHIRDMQTRSIFAEILLKLIYEYRVSREANLEHITLVEEARNIAPARRDEDPPSVGERMISELRKFGEAMIFVTQFPTQVASEIVKNSGVRIIHRIAWVEDLRLIGEAMNLTNSQIRYISNLKVGEAVVSLARIQRPILIQVNAEPVLSIERRDLSLSGSS